MNELIENIEKYKEVYQLAEEFMDKLISENKMLNKEILERHLKSESKFDNISDANKRLIESLANRQMMPSVIKFQEREEIIKKILGGYNPKEIIKKYSDSEELFKNFKEKFDIKNAESKRNLWRKFAIGIISGSRFLSSFKDKEEFDKFVKTFNLNKYTKASLPMLLSKEIEGFGLALSCDFLKELGYRDYPKPDVHLIKIFNKLNLARSTDPYEVYKSIIEMSEIVNKDAYRIDKIFWLISSGNFYLDNIKIGRNRDKFIEYAKASLSKRKDLEEGEK